MLYYVDNLFGEFMINTSNEYRLQLEEKYKDIIEENPSLNRKLVSFQANKKVPFYSWFSYKEGFYSEMVKMFIKEYCQDHGSILDPFAGSCTTLFSAREMGFDSSGIEILPIAKFITKSRMAAERVDIKELISQMAKIKK